jgi:hypothetical protein
MASNVNSSMYNMHDFYFHMHKKPNMSCSIAIGQYYFIYATNKIVLSGLTLFTFFLYCSSYKNMLSLL